MTGPRRIATVLLTHEELDLILAALDQCERRGELPPYHRAATEAIRGEIHQARQRTGLPPGESGMDS